MTEPKPALRLIIFLPAKNGAECVPGSVGESVAPMMPQFAVLEPSRSTKPPHLRKSVFVALSRDGARECWNAFKEPADCYRQEHDNPVIGIYEYERVQ